MVLTGINKVSNYFSWLFQQMKGWDTKNYVLIAFAFGLQLMSLLTAPITVLSVATFLGTMLGVLCISGITACKSINGLFGTISALCLIFVGFQAKNYLSIAEQIAYIATLDLPVLLSVKTWNNDTVNHLKRLDLKGWIITLVSTVAVFFGSMILIQTFTNDPRPMIDALSFSVCLIAGLLCFMRYSDQYFFWLASGLLQMALWGVTAYQGDANGAMFASCSIYVLNDVIAFSGSPWYPKKLKK